MEKAAHIASGRTVRTHAPRVSPGGGKPEVLVAAARETSTADAVYGPHLLTDETILLTVAPSGAGSDWDKAQIVAQSLKSGEGKVLIEGGSDARYVPTGSADGRRIAFQSDRDGDRAIFWQPADGGVAERLTRPDEGTAHVPNAWSPDGETLLFDVMKGAEVSLQTLTMRDKKVVPFSDVHGQGVPTGAAFSPDGRWVAYQSGPGGGETDTFVQPFPPTGMKFQIGRGGRPVWSRDGKELFFVPGPGQFASVAVSTRPAFAFLRLLHQCRARFPQLAPHCRVRLTRPTTASSLWSRPPGRRRPGAGPPGSTSCCTGSMS